MAKTYKKRRYYKSKGRWSSNIQEFNSVGITFSPGQSSGTTTLMTNPIQNTASVSQQFTIKNIELTFSVEESTNGEIEAVTAYIMFVPQGMQVGQDYNIQHPEYIMNYKYIGSPSQDIQNSQAQPIRVRSRLSRRLQTGDSIILFIKATNQGSADRSVNLSGLVRWWTKAN